MGEVSPERRGKAGRRTLNAVDRTIRVWNSQFWHLAIACVTNSEFHSFGSACLQYLKRCHGRENFQIPTSSTICCRSFRLNPVVIMTSFSYLVRFADPEGSIVYGNLPEERSPEGVIGKRVLLLSGNPFTGFGVTNEERIVSKVRILLWTSYISKHYL